MKLNHFTLCMAAAFIFTKTSTAEVRTAPPKKTTHELIQLLLSQDLGSRKFAFTDVVHAASGKKIIALDPANKSHQHILKTIQKAASEALTELSKKDSPVQQLRRINEASRFFENLLRSKINSAQGFSCHIPINAQGNQQRSGYPDLHILYTSPDGTKIHTYLDPKLFEKKSRASSLRTFYYEPRTRTNKIQHDALHLLLGISHNGQQNAWIFSDWELCDLSKFQVRLKAEFQASNRELYRNDVIIRSSGN